MKDIKTFMVGIPAHNEENTISRLIDSILSQRVSNFKLKKIAIFSDASVDKTNSIVSGIKNKKVELIKSNLQIGKTGIIKKLIKKANLENVDFIVFIDADLFIKDKNMIEKLLNNIAKNDMAIAVSGFALPLPAKNLIERIGYYGFYLWEELIMNSGNKKMYFRSSDPLIVLRNSEFSENKIKAFSYMHDEFYYLFAKKNRKIFGFEKNAVVYFKLPGNLADYKKQTLRYISKHISEQDREKLGEDESDFSFVEKIKGVKATIKNDYLACIYYFILHIYIHLEVRIKSQAIDSTWTQVASTKTL